MKRLKKGDRLEIPYQCSDGVYTLMNECWALDAKSRPRWEDIFVKLGELAERESKVWFVFGICLDVLHKKCLVGEAGNRGGWLQ